MLCGHSRLAGGLFSVALACGLPRVGVTHHPALRSPDVPRATCVTRGRLVNPSAIHSTVSEGSGRAPLHRPMIGLWKNLTLADVAFWCSARVRLRTSRGTVPPRCGRHNGMVFDGLHAHEELSRYVGQGGSFRHRSRRWWKFLVALPRRRLRRPIHAAAGIRSAAGRNGL